MAIILSILFFILGCLCLAGIVAACRDGDYWMTPLMALGAIAWGWMSMRMLDHA